MTSKLIKVIFDFWKNKISDMNSKPEKYMEKIGKIIINRI